MATNNKTCEDSSLVLLSCPSKGTIARASSVLQRNSKLYGPMNALKDDEQTCWNSDGMKSEQVGEIKVFYKLDFGRTVQVKRIELQYQAGFVGEMVDVSIITNNHGQEDGGDEEVVLEEEELEDSHDIQTLEMDSLQTCNGIKLTFDEFSDFYGRVTIYRIRVWGKEVSA
mmetsp:Transcript_27130/g.38160  ORF Transcript_27130/g.38160 Transcript_27130/m.38160 type:complete len:170 (-) Transcript_27130:405-914(-)